MRSREFFRTRGVVRVVHVFHARLRFSASDNSVTGTFVLAVMIVNTCVLVVLVGSIFYLLVSAGNGRVNDILDQSGNDCDASGMEDEGSNEDDRSHLLPVA